MEKHIKLALYCWFHFSQKPFHKYAIYWDSISDSRDNFIFYGVLGSKLAGRWLKKVPGRTIPWKRAGCRKKSGFGLKNSWQTGLRNETSSQNLY